MHVHPAGFLRAASGLLALPGMIVPLNPVIKWKDARTIFFSFLFMGSLALILL